VYLLPTILYTVRPGDTLWTIAEKFNTSVNDIARYNGIAEPDEIFPTQRLRIPVTSPPSSRWYIVRPGDSLFRIADRFNTTIPELVRLNQLRDPNVIYVGQVMRVR